MIFSVTLPVFDTVTVFVALPPTLTLLKATDEGLIESCGAATALPVRSSVCGDDAALSVKETLPLAALADVGVNCTPRVMLCPAGKVFGSDSPLIVNPLPVTVAAVRSRLAFPLLIRLTLSELVWPMVTLLKFNAVGESVSVGSVPVPASETAMGESVASLVTVREPVAAPADCGAKRTCTVELWPAGIVDEGFPPTILKAAPEIAACEIFTVAVPVLVTVRLSVLLLPTTTPPKLRLVELAESVPVADPPCEPVVPAALVV